MLKKNKLVNIILTFVLSAAVAVSFTGCGSIDSSTSSSSASSSATTESSSSEESSAEESSEVSEESSSETSSESSAEAESGKNGSAYTEGTTVGEGENQFAFEVVLEDGSTTLYHVMTDQTTVGAALMELGLIEGDDSEYGLFVKTVNDVTLDFEADGKYWAFYVDGEYATTGVDATDIVPGGTYAFKVES